jgi:hypothetical protein
MDRETELRHAIDVAESKLNYMWVFIQETGEEGIVHDMTLEEAIERYPEWTYSHREAVRDHFYYEWNAAWEELDFHLKTQGISEEELEGYLDCLHDELVYDYDY